jgi:NADH:ubiquinone oxidoreductase subunit 2 (subunit N)
MFDHKIYNDSSSSTKIHLISLAFLALFTTAVISSFDLFFFYISIEGMSFSTILMFVFSGKPKITVRSAIRYFCLNAFASGCLLFSIALFYGFCNNTSFTAFVETTHDFVLMPNSFIALVIFFFIFVGFKLALFPLGA